MPAASRSTQFAEWATIVATAATVLLALVGFAYSFGKLETRVENVEKATVDLPTTLAIVKLNLDNVKDLPKDMAELNKRIIVLENHPTHPVRNR